MASRIDFSLVYEGADADESAIGFYDVAEALIGFERSLAITTHLVLNGQVITQAPALKGAFIYALPPQPGSWKFSAVVAATAAGIVHINGLPKDTPLGNMVRSAYDFVVSETLGFHVDYDKTLGQQFEDYKRSHPNAKPITESKLDAVIEKCSPSIKAMHRPIAFSETAMTARIVSGGKVAFPQMDRDTYDYVDYTRIADAPSVIEGRVSSYNINTFKGRIFSFDEQRPIPFILSDNARTDSSVQRIIDSMRSNALSKVRGDGDLRCSAYPHFSRTDTVKRYTITSVSRLV